MTVVRFDDEGDELRPQVAVLRTHDIEAARTLAKPMYWEHLASPRLGWLRLTTRANEETWVTDRRRGTPCVIFVMTDYPRIPDKENQHDSTDTAVDVPGH